MKATRSQETSGPTDATIDSPSPPSSSSDRSIAPAGPCVHLTDDSACPLAETRHLLRSRLRVASLTLCIAFGAILSWSVFNIPSTDMKFLLLVGSQMFVTAMLGACAVMLCRHCSLPTSSLRIKELLIFGGPALFLGYWQYVYMTTHAATYHVLPSIAGAWLILAYIYAMFIPNTWQRAAVVIGVFGTAPVVLALILTYYDHHCFNAGNADYKYFSEMSLVMGIGVVSSTIGVYTIGNLRREAFVAKQLGQYKLGQRIGSGGMGEVYLAEHLLMKRPCAIKVIRPEKAGDPRVLARFEREVRATAKLSHWNNIDIYDYGRADDGTFYYVMEYLPGLSVNDLVKRYGPLPAERAIYLLRQTCDALGEAHDAGLVHRDIKPANIFASQRGGMYDIAKLLDFGLAKPLTDARSAQLTQEGSITGSPLFMSPEQVTGDQEPDARSDIYCLGAVAYFMLTGQPPFDGESPMKVLIAHTTKPPVPPSQLQADVPYDLEAVVLRCLAKSPDERYHSAAELAAALDDCAAAGRWTRQSAELWWRDHKYETTAELQPAEV